MINVTGSAALGFFLFWNTECAAIDPLWRPLIAVGFLGTYTTFATFAYESFALLQSGEWLRFGLNVIGNNVLCLLGVALGAMLARCRL